MRGRGYAVGAVGVLVAAFAALAVFFIDFGSFVRSTASSWAATATIPSVRDGHPDRPAAVYQPIHVGEDQQVRRGPGRILPEDEATVDAQHLTDGTPSGTVTSP